MKIKFLFMLYLLLGFISAANAMDERLFKEADAIYMSAVDGDEDQVERAIEYFDGLNESAPYDLLVKTYRGSIETLMAAHVFMPWNKMKHAELGAEMMDDALDELAAEHDSTTLGGTALSVRMRLIAAHTFFRFPRFLNRYQDSKELVADILASAQFKKSSTNSKNSLYGLAALMAEADGDKQKQAEFLGKIQ